MAYLDLTVNADTSQAQRNLQRLESNLDGLKGSLNSLKGAIAGLAIGNFITQALNAGIAIKKMADATGIAASTVNGFAQAIAAAGGTTDRALDGISDLTKNIGEAAKGSAELQKAFKDAGVSIDDLRNLSEQDILRKTIDGLAKMPDSATRTAVGMKLMGESIKGIDLAKVNRDVDGYIAKSQGMVGALTAAQGAQVTMNTAMKNLSDSIILALEPLNKFIAELDPKQISDFVRNMAELGKIIALVAGTFALFKYVVDPLKKVSGELVVLAVEGWTVKEALGKAFGGVTGPIRNLWRDLTNITDALFGGAKAGLAGATVLERFGLAVAGILGVGARLLGWLGIAYTAFEALSFVIEKINGTGLVDWFDRAGKAIANFFGVSYKTEKEKQALAEQTKKNDEDELKRIQNKANSLKEENQQQQQKREVIDAIAEAVKQQTAELNKQVDAYRNANANVERRLKFEQSLIGLSEQQKAVRQALFDAESSYISEVTKLTELYAEKSKSSKKEDEEMLPVIQAAIQKVTASYQEQINVVGELTKQNQKLLELENQRKALADFTAQTQIANADALRAIQDDMAKATMTEIEKKYYDIARAAEDSARRAIQAEQDRRKAAGVDPMSEAEIKKYYETARQGVAKLQQQQKQSYDYSRTWSTGWIKAFKDYREAAGDNAKRAQEIFSKVTQGMEDAIVDFVKTGKFEWKKFTASLLEDILRGQIRQGISNMLGPIADMFGLDLGSLGGGQATGQSPSNPMYVMDVSGGGGFGFGGGMGGFDPYASQGGRMPSTVSGGGFGGGLSNVFGQVSNAVSGIWDSVQSFGSGVWDTVSNIGSGIWDTVSNIGSSIGDLFGGWFANGGTLGAGKWGIAGENGPEIISGPASITPMGMGGVTNVTYNINAVDAMSFKALVAADPAFIHAVAQQGAGSIPSRR